ncbi:MAG: stage IV sporulation protein A [Clostridia bacterium]|nr:stage IV sporulation protein A [Clostridia bacterium]MBQ8637346.1 stage IV sporulation protein A [Clostridia bacterium]
MDNIYRDIAERTNGDIYIGVVGPVRTGKSTFIKRFMDYLVIPNIDNEYSARRAKDELPQSAAGRTIMTTEPKFIPNEAAQVNLGDNAHMRVRLIDCVGYIVDAANGYMEEDGPRMVNTPWSDEAMPFVEAAELGTKKVIHEHSNIGLVVTTDGSIADIPRHEYLEAEGRVINELKAINKPFVVLLNSTNPTSPEAKAAKREIEEKYGVSALAVNCRELDGDDISRIIEAILFEFPIDNVRITLPRWLMGLPNGHWLKDAVYGATVSASEQLSRISDVRNLSKELSDCEYVQSAYVDGIDLGSGSAKVELTVPDKLFYRILGEESGFDIEDEDALISLIKELARTKKEYDRVEQALISVRQTGYGIVAPSTEELSLEEPKIVRRGNKFGVKLSASAPSIHMIKADIKTEVNPIVGNEKQSEELVKYLLSDFESDPQKIWESNIFGKSLYELVNEGLNNKLSRMPDEARAKIGSTLERIINEGSGGLICIIL